MPTCIVINTFIRLWIICTVYIISWILWVRSCYCRAFYSLVRHLGLVGMYGSVLNSFKSYLCCAFHVKMWQFLRLTCLPMCCPQSSVLDPLLLITYSAPLSTLISILDSCIESINRFFDFITLHKFVTIFFGAGLSSGINVFRLWNRTPRTKFRQDELSKKQYLRGRYEIIRYIDIKQIYRRLRSSSSLHYGMRNLGQGSNSAIELSRTQLRPHGTPYLCIFDRWRTLTLLKDRTSVSARIPLVF